GLAEIDYRKGNYDQGLTSTEADVPLQDKKKGDGKAPIRIKDFDVTGDVLGLALRADVQKRNTLRAKQILGYLRRLAGEGQGAAEPTTVPRSLIGDLQVQVRELKKSGDKAKLDTTIKNFSAFIDDLANKKEGKGGLQLKDVMFLATCYS